MVSSVEKQTQRSDLVLWMLVSTLVLAGVGTNFYFSAQSFYLRTAISLVLAVVTLLLCAKTEPGKTFIMFWHSSVIELRKVVWPTRKETVQMTLAVMLMVIVMGILLWTLDSILGKLMAWLLGAGG